MRTGLFFLVVSAAVSMRASTPAATLFVDLKDGADHTAIQPAINAAADGDTVLVKPGTHSLVEGERSPERGHT